MTGIGGVLASPFYTGLGFTESSDVPSLYAVSIDGMSFIIDDTKYQRQMVPIVRQGSDQGNEPGEQSLTNIGHWSRHCKDWTGGAGQRVFDDADSERNRFYQSQGLNPWTSAQISLLNDTEQKRSTANTNLKLMVAGTYLYMVDGTGVVFTSDPTPSSPSFTSATGLPGTSILDISTDGTSVFVTTASAVYKAAVGVAAFASFSAGSFQVAQVVNGRLIAGKDNVIGEIDNAGTFTGLYTHKSTAFRWSVIWSGPTRIYAFGFALNIGELYSIGVTEATGALTQPVIATYLPPGEIVYAAMAYVGLMLLGTSAGVRIASVDSTGGSLTYGPAIDDAGAVRCLTAEGLFAWFGWTNYTSAVTGLGRLGFEFPFTAPLTPAFATDVMASAQGAVTGVVRYGSKCYFVVSGVGLYGETTTILGSGTLNTGWVTYGTHELKTYVDIDLFHQALDGTITVTVQKEDGTSSLVWTSSDPGSFSSIADMSLGGVREHALRFLLTFTKGSGNGPVLTHWTVRAAPSPNRHELISVPLIFHSTVAVGLREQQYVDFDRITNYLALVELATNGRVVVYQEGNQSWLVKIEDVALQSAKWDSERDWYESVVTVTMLTVR